MYRFRVLGYFGFFLLLLGGQTVWAQGWGFAEGRVLAADSQTPLPGATILVAGTDFGTVSNKNGQFSLRLPAGTHRLRISFVGYDSFEQSLTFEAGRTQRLEAKLKLSAAATTQVTVEAKPTEAGVQSVTPEMVQAIPGPFKDGFRALKNLPGVMSNNELSNEYSVRGGGYNENLIFINGFEVYKPFRTRQGEQEGLGLLNPDLAERITLYTGGFPARYGGKLASALDVQYKQPRLQGITGAVYASTLDAGGSISAARGKLGLVAGVRQAQARAFFGSQELKGSYDPRFTDAQALLNYTLKTGHEVQALGMWARHRFRLEPSQRKTYYGTFDDLRSVWVNYSGEENDGHDIRFSGLKISDVWSPQFRMEHRAAYFDIAETEQYKVRADATLYLIDPSKSDPNSPINDLAFGAVVQEDQADNRVRVTTWTAEGRYTYTLPRVVTELGWHVRQLRWQDQLSESSAVQGQNRNGDLVRVPIETLQDELPDTFSRQAGLYLQTVTDLFPEAGKAVLTAGLRTDYFDFNQDWSFSPRLSATYRLSEGANLSAAWGLYEQAPSYRELRGETVVDETISGALNRNLKAQHAVFYSFGGTYFAPQRRLYLRAEAYYKTLKNLISYTVENTRVTYSGENDSEGYAYGFDFQVRSELVPGLESWLNYGYLVSRERFLPAFTNKYNTGWVPRAFDQRHTFSALVQDAVSKDDSWRVYLQAMYGSGLPYTPPTPGEFVNNVALQQPGKRHSQRFSPYKRADLGITKMVLITKKGLGISSQPPKLLLSLEFLNIFDMTNTIAYTWVDPGTHIWERIPTRLTPRTINARLRVQF